MRKLTADFILHSNGKLVKNHSLLIEDDGTIAELVDHVLPDANFTDGILCPGFINTHCHLELSYLYKNISRGTGLTGFIGEFIKARIPDDNSTVEAAIIADAIMWNNGIQAVGDICNGQSTFAIKAHSPIRYHSFIELFNPRSAQAESTYANGVILLEKVRKLKLSASLVPHAPYTVPGSLHQLIQKHCEDNESPWCIHNQETASEDELFENGTGILAEFFNELGFTLDWLHANGKNSLQTTGNYFPGNSNLLLVHNTFTKESDIKFLKMIGALPRTWIALCPKANLYIENKLPDIPMLIKQSCKLTVGTDSLASNDSLSILEELKTIHRNFPDIPIAELITWATHNGADYFGWFDLGRFQKGARPGVVQISGATDSELHEQCVVKRLF